MFKYLPAINLYFCAIYLFVNVSIELIGLCHPVFMYVWVSRGSGWVDEEVEDKGWEVPGYTKLVTDLSNYR